MDKPQRNVAPVLERMYQFILWLIPTVDKFPRSQKFALGERIQITALDVLGDLVEASYRRDRQQLLVQSNMSLEKLRILLRLVYKPINNETCFILSHAHPMTRSLPCARPNCILPTRIVS